MVSMGDTPTLKTSHFAAGAMISRGPTEPYSTRRCQSHDGGWFTFDQHNLPSTKQKAFGSRCKHRSSRIAASIFMGVIATQSERVYEGGIRPIPTP